MVGAIESGRGRAGAPGCALLGASGHRAAVLGALHRSYGWLAQSRTTVQELVLPSVRGLVPRGTGGSA
jgi:hypothetical protein